MTGGTTCGREARLNETEEHSRRETGAVAPDEVLPPENVVAFVAWHAASPPGGVLTEGIIAPLKKDFP